MHKSMTELPGLNHDDNPLALFGGIPTRTKPAPPMFPGGMKIDAEEKRAVLDVLDDKTLFRYYGPVEFNSKVAQFEQDFSEFLGTQHALAVNSGTSALITALVAHGIGPGQEVIIPGYTFIASAAAVLAARAIPVIAEVDDSLTLDPVDLEKRITPHTAAIIPVHMRGAPCAMGSIMEIARRNNLAVIEDVAQAIGGSYKGHKLGTFGGLGAFSLQLHKIVTTGEGGVVITDDPGLFARAKMYHDAAGFWRSDYTGETLLPGVNYRMSEIAGALGLVQIKRLKNLIKTMKALKSRLKNGISSINTLSFRKENDKDGDTAVCLIFFLPEASITQTVVTALKAENVGASVLFEPNVSNWHVYANWKHIIDQNTLTKEGCPYRCPYYGGKAQNTLDSCPQTLELLSRAIHIDINPLYTFDEIDQIIEAIYKVFKWYGLNH